MINLITKILKKSWKILVGIAVILIGILTLSNIRKRKAINKIDKKIIENEKATEKLQGKIEQVEEQKIEVKKNVVAKKKQIQKTKQQIKEKPATRKKSTTAAKKNILSKTKKK